MGRRSCHEVGQTNATKIGNVLRCMPSYAILAPETGRREKVPRSNALQRFARRDSHAKHSQPSRVRGSAEARHLAGKSRFDEIGGCSKADGT